MTVSATPPRPGVYADRTLPLRRSSVTAAKLFSKLSALGNPALVPLPSCGRNTDTVAPACLKWFATTSEVCAVVTAKETSVGGTVMSSKVPLMESLPPIAPTPNCSCASSAPRSAASGFPQRTAS